jgi:RNA polymerase sigma factor (sigma-70 family)
MARAAVTACDSSMPGGAVDPRIAEACRCHDGELRRFLARRVGCRDEADDLAQEVYLRIARCADLDRVDCLRAFMFQTALNLVRDRSRRLYTKAMARSSAIDDLELPSHEDPARSIEVGEQLDRACDVVEEMPEKRRRALLMHRFDGHTYDEIACAMAVSVSMVEKHISAALVQLRGCLADA